MWRRSLQSSSSGIMPYLIFFAIVLMLGLMASCILL
jgi:hypothetical protein